MIRVDNLVWDYDICNLIESLTVGIKGFSSNQILVIFSLHTTFQSIMVYSETHDDIATCRNHALNHVLNMLIIDIQS